VNWFEEPIAKHHDCASFDCGKADLNLYLQRHARQNHQNGGAKTFMATPDSKQVLGYYCLSSASVSYERAPDLIRRGLARYEIPAFRLGRLAVDRSVQGQGLGGELLLSAGRRCLKAAAEVGGVALLIDAKNEPVAGWYERFGALRLVDAPLTLLLSLATIANALNE
jgi:GNAT superfamily N-acetyltransferase